MKFALSLGLTGLALGCSVPSVEFSEAGVDAAFDATTDSPDDAASDSPSEAGNDAPLDSSNDVADGSEASTFFCGDSGVRPVKGTCCGNGGPVCIGSPCNSRTCGLCNCEWPQVCCVTSGNTASCQDVTLCP
jgi:hypothetical protein